MGPVVPLLFAGVEFHICKMVANRYSIVGIIMALLFIGAPLAANFLTRDCSKIFEMHIQKTWAWAYDIFNNKGDYFHVWTSASALKVTKKLCRNSDILLLFVTNFIGICTLWFLSFSLSLDFHHRSGMETGLNFLKMSMILIMKLKNRGGGEGWWLGGTDKKACI